MEDDDEVKLKQVGKVVNGVEMVDGELRIGSTRRETSNQQQILRERGRRRR